MSSTERDELDVRVCALEAKNEELAATLARLAPDGRKRASRRNWAAYAAVIASLVGLLALTVSAYTAHLQRRQLQATVWPKLEIGNSNLNPKLYLFSQGLGPAVVKAVRVTVDDRPMRTWDEVVHAFGHGGRAGIHFSGVNGRVFPADKQFEMAWPRGEDSRTMFLDVLEGRNHSFSVTLCYCSVMDECYVARYGQMPVRDRAKPERGEDECPVTEPEQFAN